MNIVSRKEINKRINTNYTYNVSSETYETNQSYKCGCGENHFEFVVICGNNFETLIENDLKLRTQFSIISAKI